MEVDHPVFGSFPGPGYMVALSSVLVRHRSAAGVLLGTHFLCTDTRDGGEGQTCQGLHLGNCNISLPSLQLFADGCVHRFGGDLPLHSPHLPPRALRLLGQSDQWSQPLFLLHHLRPDGLQVIPLSIIKEQFPLWR